VKSVWDERAEAYRDSDAHRQGEDLELLVEWAAGAQQALDVATGGGHVARRLREAGLDVVTCDPAPGMRPDVICRAEHLPFADGSFDVVACRVAAHHFEDPDEAVREMARVTRDRVLISDTVFMGERAEEAERLRDPSHVRNYSEEEWLARLDKAGLVVEETRKLSHPILFEPWLERTGCSGEEAERVRELLADRIDGDRLRLDRLVIRARKARS
jgi:ubiquinone/menaquinone biosynthesis C-methylase UbiE